MVGVTWKGARTRSTQPSKELAAAPPPQAENSAPPRPTISFRDKDAYQDLFQPLPKPEPIPQLTSFKIEAKSWRQLQEEREAMVNQEIERTKNEALQMWERTKSEDNKRIQGIQSERNRMEREQAAREQILRREAEERQEKDMARRMEINRQEELLQGRTTRAKTADPSYLDHMLKTGNGIQIYHYKDPAVAEIVKHTRLEEIRRRASQPENQFNPPPQHAATSHQQGGQMFVSQVNHIPAPAVAGQLPPAKNGDEAAGNIYRNVMDGKEFFKGGVVVRSQSSSSSSTTSR